MACTGQQEQWLPDARRLHKKFLGKRCLSLFGRIANIEQICALGLEGNRLVAQSQLQAVRAKGFEGSRGPDLKCRGNDRFVQQLHRLLRVVPDAQRSKVQVSQGMRCKLNLELGRLTLEATVQFRQSVHFELHLLRYFAHETRFKSYRHRRFFAREKVVITAGNIKKALISRYNRYGHEFVIIVFQRDRLFHRNDRCRTKEVRPEIKFGLRDFERRFTACTIHRHGVRSSIRDRALHACRSQLRRCGG